MRKTSSMIMALSLVGSSAFANSLKVFHASESPAHPCKLAKSVGGKWLLANEQEMNGQEFAATVSKANADYSNFKYNGTWYAVRSECLQDSNNSSASGSSSNAGKKYYVELRAQKYFMIGSGAGGGATDTAGRTNGTLAASLGVGGRIGYYWRPDKVLFLDIDTLKAAQTTTYVGTPSGTTTATDSIMMINIGYQMLLKSKLLGLAPYIAGSLGYAKLSEDFIGTLSGTDVKIAQTGASFDVKLEGGGTYSFTSHLDGVLSLAYTYLGYSTKTVSASNYPSAVVGTAYQNTIGFSHVTLAGGPRYTF